MPVLIGLFVIRVSFYIYMYNNNARTFNGNVFICLLVRFNVFKHVRENTSSVMLKHLNDLLLSYFTSILSNYAYDLCGKVQTK